MTAGSAGNMRPGIDPAAIPGIPRQFECKACATLVREIIFGQGFHKCGMVQDAQGPHWLCEKCYGRVLALLKEISNGPG